MGAPPKDLIALTAKLKRAKDHIFHLRERWRAFVDSGAYPIIPQDTPDGDYRIYYLGNITPIPSDIPSIIGDAIQNLRSALDHWAYRLVCVGTKSAGPFDGIYFPIADEPNKLEAKIQAIKPCLADDAVKALRDVQAYPRGHSEVLWQIHTLNNIDKHRLLLTISSLNRQHSMSPAEIAKIRHQFLGVLKDIPEANEARMFLKSSARHISLESGHVLGIFPISQVHDNMHFPIEVAFGEPKIVEGKPVIEMLTQAAHLMHTLLMNFDRLGLLD
jgi:hypothetical protein